MTPTAVVAPSDLRAMLAEIAAGSAHRERAGEPPHDAVDLVRHARLGALRVPAAEGGAGASVRGLLATLIDLAEADANVAHILRAHFWFVELRLLDTDPGRRARWLTQVADGLIFGNATSELGTRAAGDRAFATRLARNGGHYRLTGTKYYSTGSLFSDWIAVYACDDKGRPVCAVIPVDRPGVTLEDDWDGIGQRLTGTGTTRLEAVRVEPDEVIELPHPDEPLPSYIGAFLQLYLTAVIAGVTRSIVEDAVALVRGRTRSYTHAVTPEPAADPQLQQVVGEIAGESFAAEATVLAAADAIDAAAASVAGGLPDPELAATASLRAAQAKVVVDRLAPRIATQLFDVGGASATRRSQDLDRHWRNVRTLASHNPTVYKARAIGDRAINGAPLPPNGFF